MSLFKDYCTETKSMEKILHFKTCVGGGRPLTCPPSWKVSMVKHMCPSTHTHTHTLTIPLQRLCLGAKEPEVLEDGESSASQQGLLPRLEGQAWALRWCRQIQPIPALFVQIIRKVPISPYFHEGFCVVNICPLASGQGPSPFHRKHQTAVRWSWVWVNWPNEHNAPCYWGGGPTSYYPSLDIQVSTLPNS